MVLDKKYDLAFFIRLANVALTKVPWPELEEWDLDDEAYDEKVKKAAKILEGTDAYVRGDAYATQDRYEAAKAIRRTLLRIAEPICRVRPAVPPAPAGSTWPSVPCAARSPAPHNGCR